MRSKAKAVGRVGDVQRVAFFDLQASEHVLRQDHADGVADLHEFEGGHDRNVCYNERYNTAPSRRVQAPAEATLLSPGTVYGIGLADGRGGTGPQGLGKRERRRLVAAAAFSTRAANTRRSQWRGRRF